MCWRVVGISGYVFIVFYLFISVCEVAGSSKLKGKKRRRKRGTTSELLVITDSENSDIEFHSEDTASGRKGRKNIRDVSGINFITLPVVLDILQNSLLKHRALGKFDKIFIH